MSYSYRSTACEPLITHIFPAIARSCDCNNPETCLHSHDRPLTVVARPDAIIVITFLHEITREIVEKTSSPSSANLSVQFFNIEYRLLVLLPCSLILNHPSVMTTRKHKTKVPQQRLESQNPNPPGVHSHILALDFQGSLWCNRINHEMVIAVRTVFVAVVIPGVQRVSRTCFEYIHS